MRLHPAARADLHARCECESTRPPALVAELPRSRKASHLGERIASHCWSQTVGLPSAPRASGQWDTVRPPRPSACSAALLRWPVLRTTARSSQGVVLGSRARHTVLNGTTAVESAGNSQVHSRSLVREFPYELRLRRSRRDCGSVEANSQSHDQDLAPGSIGRRRQDVFARSRAVWRARMAHGETPLQIYLCPRWRPPCQPFSYLERALSRTCPAPTAAQTRTAGPVETLPAWGPPSAATG